MMLYKSFVVLCLLTYALPAYAGENYALLVGVNEYDKRGLRTLSYAERDVKVLGEELTKRGYKVRTMLGSLKNKDPLRATKLNIEKQVDEWLLNGKNGRNKNDIVLIAFCGHGMQKELIVPAKDEDGKTYYKFAKNEDGEPIQDAYYCPVDALKDEAETLVSLTGLMARLGKKGGINLMLVDACRDDPTRSVSNSSRSLTGNELNGKVPANSAVMFSCAAGQQALETAELGGGHGIFMYYVIEGLKGKAVDPDGNVNWSYLDFM